jgi:thiol:disulfide interchange protein DsbA
MMRSLAFPALLVSTLLMSACQPSAPAADAGATGAATAAGAPAGPSAEAEAAAASAAAAAGAQVKTPPDGAAADPADAVDPAADATSQAPADNLVEGEDYAVIAGGQPFQARNGKVEVVEVFNYICPACARFEPSFSAWKARQPADVRVTYLPAPWGAQWIPYAQAYYVADAMGLDGQTHGAMFKAIHIDQTLPGEGKKPDDAKVAAFYTRFGADAKQFLADMHSFGTDAKLKRGQQFIAQSQVGGTPTIVVDGKYRVLGRTYDDMLRITDALVARERAAAQAAGAP